MKVFEDFEDVEDPEDFEDPEDAEGFGDSEKDVEGNEKVLKMLRNLEDF